mmetsp:Transcript_8160/g.12919  ORF Transcript_8160/g.12919 Transcript_8160/m.12919 type:complete len:252 (-) Transcript_8160:8-763(-)
MRHPFFLVADMNCNSLGFKYWTIFIHYFLKLSKLPILEFSSHALVDTSFDQLVIFFRQTLFGHQFFHFFWNLLLESLAAVPFLDLFDNNAVGELERRVQGFDGLGTDVGSIVLRNVVSQDIRVNKFNPTVRPTATNTSTESKLDSLLGKVITKLIHHSLNCLINPGIHPRQGIISLVVANRFHHVIVGRYQAFCFEQGLDFDRAFVFELFCRAPIRERLDGDAFWYDVFPSGNFCATLLFKSIVRFCVFCG